LPFAFIEKARNQKIAVTVNGSKVHERNQHAVNDAETQVVKLVKAIEKYREISEQPEQKLNNSEVYFVHADAP